MKGISANAASPRRSPSVSATAAKPTAKQRREAQERVLAEKNANLLELRNAAVMRLCFQADSIAEAHEAVLDILQANLARAGAERVNPELKVEYNPYSPSGSGIGFLSVSVRMNWSRLDGTSLWGLRDLAEGLPKSGFSYADDGRPLRQKADGSLVSFSVPVSKEDDSPGLVMLKSVIDQEKALLTALASLRQAQEASAVSKTLQKGSGEDQRVLQAEADLKQAVADLEQQLEEKREELGRATEKADGVRKRLREAETPASKAIRAQLNAARDKLGMKHA